MSSFKSEDYKVGAYIGYRMEELGVRDYFVVPGKDTPSIGVGLNTTANPMQETPT